jgi:3-hydroxybutyryl-CoA dehydrogenase
MSTTQYIPEIELKTVGVVGVGVIGRGVAHALAQVGLRVIAVDIDEAVLSAARDEIAAQLRFQGLFKKKDAGAHDPAAVLSRIELTTQLGALASADFVVENAPEKWPIKEALFRELDRVCPATTVLAANTSCIPITRLASVTGREDRVIGTHFMNPVHLKPLVEVIRGRYTSDHTLDVTRRLLAAMGKEMEVVGDAPGFVTNRVLMVTINEAISVVEGEVAPPEQVDRLFKGCFEHKMGPLETADLIGLDTILHSLEVLHESFGDPKYEPCRLLRKMVADGQLGRKATRGFYDYGAQ